MNDGDDQQRKDDVENGDDENGSAKNSTSTSIIATGIAISPDGCCVAVIFDKCVKVQIYDIIRDGPDNNNNKSKIRWQKIVLLL